MNYKKLKFKAGLEIHQQLETNKLFCDCPSTLMDKKPEIIIKRKLRAVAGELNEIDIAALHERLRDKEFIYEGFEKNTCSVEFDEEPPHEVNRDALEIVLQIALLLKANVPDELQIMRKTVIDRFKYFRFSKNNFSWKRWIYKNFKRKSRNFSNMFRRRFSKKSKRKRKFCNL